MHEVFNPNIPIFPPNSAEGLHFSDFNFYLMDATLPGLFHCRYSVTTMAAIETLYPTQLLMHNHIRIILE